MNRFTRRLRLLALAAATAMAAGCSPEYRAGACPYLSQITARSVVISWFAASPGQSGIQYWSCGSPESQSTSFPEKQLSPWNHVSVTLDGLSAHTRYCYRIFSRTAEGETFGPEFQFSTAPEDPTVPFFFWVYADTQNERHHREIISQMLQSPGAAFLLHCGDLVNLPCPQQWGSFFSAAAPVLSQTPFYPVYGNHDAHNPESRKLFPVLRNQDWYSFDYGAVHIIAIDSTSDYDPESEQYRWLENDLRSSASRPWKIALFHHPPYSPNLRDNTPAARNSLCPLLEQYGVTLVFNSHSHMYYRYTLGAVHYVITGGGGGWALTREPSVFNAPFHFVRVDVSPDALKVTAVRSDGTAADQFSIQRGTP